MVIRSTTVTQVLPFLKGLSLARLNQPAQARDWKIFLQGVCVDLCVQAADCLEEAIALNPGFKQACMCRCAL